MERLFLWFAVKPDVFFVSFSRTLFINTAYLGKTANVGVALVFLLAVLLLSVVCVSPAPEPGYMGVAGMGGIQTAHRQ